MNTWYTRNLRLGLSFRQRVMAHILKSPFTAIFTTSGEPSQPLSLISTCPNDNVDRWHRLTIHTTIKDSVYRGDLDGKKVVIKLAEDDMVHQLRHEMGVYTHLKDLQGKVIPICHGLFLVGGSWAFLIIEDCGTPLESFSDLTSAQR